jgi:O-antigen/teichoic acid export membrane protein
MKEMIKQGGLLNPILVVTTLLVSYIVNYFLNAFLAKNLGFTTYGDIAVAIRVLLVLAPIILLGTNVSLKKYMSFYYNTGQTKMASFYLKWNLKVIRASFAITFIIILLSSIALITLDALNIKELHEYHLAIYIIWVAPFMATSLLLAGILLSRRKYHASSIPRYLLQYIILFILFAAFVVLNVEIDNPSIVLIFLMTFLVIIAIQLALIAIYKIPFFKLLFKFNRKEKHKRTHHEVWRSVAFHCFLNSIMFILIGAIDLIIVEVFSPHEKDAGLYAAILIIVSSFRVISEGFRIFLVPHINDFNMGDDRGKFQKLLTKCNLLYVGLLFLIAALILEFSSPLLSHFGPAYLIDTTPLIILTLGYSISGLFIFSGPMLAYLGHEKKLAFISMMGLICLLVFGSVATHFYGVTGIAYVTAAVFIFMNFTESIIVRYCVGIRSSLIL